MQSLQNALLITVSGDPEKAEFWRQDECYVGCQTICLQAIRAWMSCNHVLGWAGEEVLKEYKNLHHNRRLQGGKRSFDYGGEESDGEAVIDPAGAGIRQRSRQW